MVQIVINRRTGRKRKTNVRRDASGKSRGEILDLSVIFNQPHRRGQRNPKSELLGYPLGRLRHEGLIDETQLQAGNAWASMVRAYSRMIGLRIGSPKSGSLTEAVATGFYVWEGDGAENGESIEPEEQERRRKRLRAKYDQCHDRLHEAGRTLGPGAALLKALRKVAIEERYPEEAELGNLRVALNTVGRVLRG
ncbi:hypothetical protein [Bradyrhizobium sp. SYSU BS000235]|uniref:hypothetical protein n=1 Tax=Bradyrhizobium sp. SYSU BS000235 TaxID=3411332 RepID=UPI003C752BDD